MATKKTSTKNTKKEETKVKKTVDTMSDDDILEMMKNNDTKAIEELKAENTPVIVETPVEEPIVVEEPVNEPEPEPEPVAEEKAVEPEPEVIAPVVEEKHIEQPKPIVNETKKPVKTTRSVYGYDHFGVIYGY